MAWNDLENVIAQKDGSITQLKSDIEKPTKLTAEIDAVRFISISTNNGKLTKFLYS